MSQPHPDVVVIGAGPAGLGAALFAARRGLSVTVLERSTRVGGLAASETIDGVRVDAGSHRLHPATPPDVMELLQSLPGLELQQRPRRGRLRVEGRWLKFPLSGSDIARTMPRAWLARVAADSAVATARSAVNRAAHEAQSFEQALRDSLGPTAYDTMYAPYAVKLWGLPGDAIDPEQARVRVTANSPIKLAARIARTRLSKWRSRTAGGVDGPQGATFWYPRQGFGQISEALSDAAEKAGARIVTGARVTSIQPGEQVRVTTDDGETITTPRVLSTIPAAALTWLMSPPAPAEITAHAAQLATRAMTFVYLTHKPPGVTGDVRWTPYDAHYLPGADTPVTRISEPVNYRDSDADPTDRTVLCAEIPCEVGDTYWSASAVDLARIVQEAVAGNDLPPLHVEGVTVRRAPSAYPVYRTGYRQHADPVEEWLQRVPGVTTFGRAGLFAHDNTHHGLVMAQDVVDCIAPTGEFEDARWAIARERFRLHVVED